MKPWDAIAPHGAAPVTWAILQREASTLFLTDIPAGLMSVGLMASPDELDAFQSATEDEFHNVSAAALGQERSTYEQAAAAGRIQWRRADTAQMRPACQVRIDAGPWRELDARQPSH